METIGGTKTVRGASGFGDALYLRSAVDLCFPEKKDIVIYNNYPELFEGYNVLPYSNGFEVDYDFTYVKRKYRETTNQFQDMLISSKLYTEDTVKGVEYNLNVPVNDIKKCKKDLLVTIEPYPGFGNGKGVNVLMTPNTVDYYRKLHEYSFNYEVKFIERKLPFQTLCDLFYSADLIYCQQGWGTALAEGLNKRCDIIFNSEALNCSDAFISSITPNKVLTKKTSKAIIL